ncbi:RidA family protein [Cuneatibacter sp. NSJ-177]|uniref:RidA family protein n=1 Tax=Cuneatibacter sp. NSJ-177 TaxID=2931401 RepID=UPI001FCFE0C9|nr:RidA family protein [Cuneatibacter sp. NSJ-177]MCJ7837519.1 RidA family protein [Cuneatibacter sp. NSJ-177]
MKTNVETKNAPAAIGPYSQAVRAGGTLYISGQIPVNPADGSIGSTLEEQAAQVLQNVEAILKAAGMTKEQVVKTTIFMKDLSGFGLVNDLYGKFFEGTVFPARACVEVSALPKGVLLEMEAVAVE